MEQIQNQTQPKKSHKWIFIIIIAGILGYFVFSFLPFLMSFVLDWRVKDSDRILEEITESIKPGPARDYKFHNPSAEVLKRSIDCKRLTAFQEKLPVLNPACLNLYKTSPEEINKKIIENKYDRIIVYGENIILDAPSSKDPKYPDWDLGKSIYDSAKFNDQITIPALLKLYDIKDLSFVSKLVPDKKTPINALYYRIGTDAEVQKACGTQDKSQFAGCALGMWSTMLSESSLGSQLSLANQKIWRNTGKEKPDYLAFDYKLPENCYTDNVFIHETAHMLLYSLRNNNPSDALVSTRYFNEHQAELVGILGMNMACGDGSVSNFRTKDGKKMTIPEFNSIYPPTKMGSFSPDPKNGCQLGMLNEWNRFLAKGNFEDQFKKFKIALESWMKEKRTIGDDVGFKEFLVKLNNDKETQTNLQYHGCMF